MGLLLVPKSTGLHDLEWRYGPLWPFFGIFCQKVLGFYSPRHEIG